MRLTLFFFILLISGCATNYGATSTDDFGKYTQLNENETTKVEIHGLFGQPHDVKYLPSGESVWTYFNVKMSTSGATFVPIVGLFAGGTNVDVRISNFYYDPEGIYSKLESQSKKQYVNQWVGIGTIAVENDELENVKMEMEKCDLPFDYNLARQMKGTSELFSK